jgi:hypothetical protein
MSVIVEEMRVFPIHLPVGDGTPQKKLHIDIPLSDGKHATIEYLWPMTKVQAEAFKMQVEHSMEVMRKFFVKPEIDWNQSDPAESPYDQDD